MRTWIRLRATTDLDAGGARRRRFLSPKNPDAARRAVATIKAGVRHLARHPESGRWLGQADSDLREAVIAFGRDGYVVLYRVEGDAIHLLAVRHGREAGY
ncbi:type II toxin-antitoxin system RelE/ParE family toxin [Methylopila sp. M107]|uniref:type II toxin-antitoxin system RelE/ParE family toxin n=1 Tax=Methylopila sp. M107 TaxID=1101190 RepID=UPI00247685FC|nr:type II toxin-antitoxin system RelE/ParE family toxin [Methylopila sp. M107]